MPCPTSNSRFVDLGGYVAQFIRGSSLYTSMRMGKCQTCRIRGMGWAVSARSVCLGLSRWRELCLPLLLDMGLIHSDLVSEKCPRATLGLGFCAVCDCFVHEMCTAWISLPKPIMSLQSKNSCIRRHYGQEMQRVRRKGDY